MSRKDIGKEIRQVAIIVFRVVSALAVIAIALEAWL